MPVLLSLFLFAGCALAQNPVVLKAARLFDGKAGALVSPGLVVVVAGKITGVGTAAQIPRDAQVIDLGDATLLPGFMDAHTHLTLPYSDDWKGGLSTAFANLSPSRRSTPRRTPARR